ncbi:MAG: hypothetical protein HY719_16510 [Planctomycetes bacterium]|nr:hypothetical protein [Planctomycetota bacterium]
MDDELFSCRNCVFNCAQSQTVGRGSGYCLQHASVILEPDETTCKYLHRKDLPHFVVDEGVREHAGEFAGFSGLVNLSSTKPIKRISYSERFAWERRSFDHFVNALAHYPYRRGQDEDPENRLASRVFIEAMAGGVDGRRMLAHASLVRRYLNQCGTWVSSYRLVLALVATLPVTPRFDDADIRDDVAGSIEESRDEALWDVFFTRIAGLEEYGFHAGLEDLMWASNQLNGALIDFNWPALREELRAKTIEWTRTIIEHAKHEDQFFPNPNTDGANSFEPIADVIE